MTIFDIFRRPPGTGPTVRDARELINYELAAERYRRAQVSGDRDEMRKAREALDAAAGAVGGEA